MAEELRLVSPEPAGRPSPTLRDLAAVLFRQRQAALAVFAIGFLAVMTYGLLAPSYKSEMKILLRRNRVDPVVTPTPSQAEFERLAITEEEVNSEVELLQDDEILRTVAENTGLSSTGHSWLCRLGGSSPEKRRACAVRSLSRHLTVEPVRKTALIDVSYHSADPEEAAKILRSLANAYLDRHYRVHRSAGEFNFFDQQLTQSQAALQAAEMRLMNFTHDEGVISSSQERDLLLQRLSDVDSERRNTEISLATNSERIRVLQAKLVSLPERELTVVRNSDNPQLMERLKGRLLELELKRTELLTQFEPTYRTVQQVDEEIAQAKAAIAVEDAAPIRDQTSALEPNHEWAKSELLRAQVEQATLEARARAEATLQRSYSNAAHELGDHAIEQERLINELKAAEARYLLYANKREEARIGDALDRGGILNVMLAEQPTVPALPRFSVLSLFLISLGSAGTLSIGLAFVRDFLNPSFRTPDEVLAFLDAPVLASLPHRIESDREFAESFR